MMSNNADKIRMRVFKIWFFTLAVILLTYAEKLSGLRHLPLPFPAIFQSFQMMIGLVSPQIVIMTAFYFNMDRHQKKINSLSPEQIKIITFLSIIYHTIFIASVIFGIGCYGFDQQVDGNSLQRNTAAVVAIMGLFSTFLAPTAFLFSKPTNDNILSG
jgi:hypothetical protein